LPVVALVNSNNIPPTIIITANISIVLKNPNLAETVRIIIGINANNKCAIPSVKAKAVALTSVGKCSTISRYV
jgi:hypothetical protein